MPSEVFSSRTLSTACSSRTLLSSTNKAVIPFTHKVSVSLSTPYCTAPFEDSSDGPCSRNLPFRGSSHWPLSVAPADQSAARSTPPLSLPDPVRAASPSLPSLSFSSPSLRSLPRPSRLLYLSPWPRSLLFSHPETASSLAKS